MFITKKRVWFLAFILILGVLQLSAFAKITPAQAGSDLINSQPILQQVGSNTYGAAQKDIKVIAIEIIQVALVFLGLACVILIMFAGFKWLTAAGNEKAVEDAKGTLKNAAIGLLIILAAWGITLYVSRIIICTTNGTGRSCTTEALRGMGAGF